MFWFNRTFMHKTRHQLLDINSCEDRPSSGCPRSVLTKERNKRIREKMRRNPRCSANKMAAEENVSRRSKQVINESLGFHPYHIRNAQDLTAAQIIKWLQRCKKLLNRHGSESIDRIIFFHETLFCTEQVIMLKMMMYIQQLSMIYLKIFEL